jgi:6-phosphogluconolactonase (cycloisomerase 2 family)
MIHKACRFPGENLYVENDLGADILYFFSIDYEREKLSYRNSYALSDHGAGPRHSAAHPHLPYLYLNYERMGAVSQYDVSDLAQIRKVRDACFVPEGMELDRRRDNQSELMFNADGNTLYSFLRGKGYAIVYDVDDKTGALTQRQFLKLPGSDPRGAVFSPDRRFILIAGHEADELETLRIRKDGTLEDTGLCTKLNSPACIAFYLGGKQ